LTSIIKEIRDIKSSPKELREFGVTIGAVLLLIAAFAFWRGRPSGPYFAALGIVFIGLGLVMPRALFALQKVWMALAVVMGFFMSRIILTALFFLVITPIGVIMRLLGRDLLDEKIDKNSSTYWQRRSGEAKTIENYWNQY